MAKAKKGKLTIEDALVPVDEQPYEIPENWCWTYLLTGAAECKDGFRKPINSSERADREGDVPYYGATGQVGWIDDYLTDEQLILLGEDGAPFLDLMKDKAYIIEGKAWVNNHAHILKSYYGEIGNKYLLYYLNTFNYHGYVNGTTRLKLTQASMNTIPVPIPPLAEQQRIVEQIENLFSKLDEAKDKAQAVLDGFEDRKSAILFKAYSGELTKKWRINNSIADDSWSKVSIKDVCKVNPPKINAKEYDDDLEVSFFPMPSLSEITGTITEPQTRKLGEVKSGFTNFIEGDVVFAKITPCMENGKSAIIPKLVNGIGYGTTEFFVLRCSEKLSNGYLYHLVRSKHFRDEAKAVMTGAVGQQRVPKAFIEDYEISLPLIEEQKEILRIVDEMVQKERIIADNCEKVIEQIDMMKKSILARVFRGELGTNIVDEESSMELLKSIIESKEK